MNYLLSDEDGDMIAFSSDEELKLVPPSVKAGVFRIYVKGNIVCGSCTVMHSGLCSWFKIKNLHYTDYFQFIILILLLEILG